MADRGLEHTATTLGGAGGLRLQAGQWGDPGVPRRAVVVLVHGFGEHLGRYDHVITALCRGGYTVFGVDHHGHGRSDGRRAASRRFDDFVDDLDRVVDLAAGQIPAGEDGRRFLLGHSMGGLIATRCALRRNDLAGLVVSDGAFKVGGNIPPVLRRVSALAARLLPDLPIVGPSPPGILSRDPEVDRRYGDDPLNYTGRVRAGLAYGMFVAGEETRARAGGLTLPLLLMHGADDHLTDPAGSVAVYEAAASPDKTLTLWPGLRHEIFNEPEGPEVIAAVVGWLDARTAGVSGGGRPGRLPRGRSPGADGPGLARARADSLSEAREGWGRSGVVIRGWWRGVIGRTGYVYVRWGGTLKRCAGGVDTVP